MNPFIDVFGWSLRLGSVGRTEWRLGILLLIWMLFELIRAIQQQPGWMMLVAAPLIPLVVMLWHTAAHVLGTALVGGATSTATASVLVDNNADMVPQSGPAIAIAAGAGPLGSALLALAGWTWDHPIGHALAVTSGMVAVANCLACHPFDGRRMWRGLLWPVLGLSRAGKATVFLGFISVAVLLVFALLRQDFLLLFMAVWCLLATLNDYGRSEVGYDPALETDPRLHRRSGPGLWERWQARRAEAAERKAQARAEADAATLDRLLAKVSAHGLPSLTEAERQHLQQISRRQRGEDAP